MIKVKYTGDLREVPSMAEKVELLKKELRKRPQYEPETKHTFHGGMYCREVFRHAGVLVVGKVHKKEHFYLVVSGTVSITTDDGVKTVTGPCLMSSMPGTRRAVYAETDALCMTFHRVESATVENAEYELVEDEENPLFLVGNKLKNEVLS